MTILALIVTGLWMITIIQYFEIRQLKLKDKIHDTKFSQVNEIKKMICAVMDIKTIERKLIEARINDLEAMVIMHGKRLDIEAKLWEALARPPKDSKPDLHVVKSNHDGIES